MKKFWNWIRSLFGWKKDDDDPVVDDPVVTDPEPEPEPDPGRPSIQDCTLTGMYRADVRTWAETSVLSAGYNGSTVTLAHSKAGKWSPDSDNLEGNPWVIVQSGGKWYATTWEHLRRGQQSKQMPPASFPGHIKSGELRAWVPQRGETFGFMVSGRCRLNIGTKERSNISWVTY